MLDSTIANFIQPQMIIQPPHLRQQLLQTIFHQRTVLHMYPLSSLHYDLPMEWKMLIYKAVPMTSSTKSMNGRGGDLEWILPLNISFNNIYHPLSFKITTTTTIQTIHLPPNLLLLKTTTRLPLPNRHPQTSKRITSLPNNQLLLSIHNLLHPLTY